MYEYAVIERRCLTIATIDMQTTSHILMIRPVNFAFNAETAANNTFQVRKDEINIQGKALKEFDEKIIVNQLYSYLNGTSSSGKISS